MIDPVLPDLGRRGLTRRQKRFFRVFFFCCGLLFLLTALIPFLGQGSQIRVRASVLSEQCHNAYDFGSHQYETRCNLAVEFTTRSGQQIRTTVGDALASEIYSIGNRQVIDLRYDPNDPSQPFKQSNYESVGIFILLMALGCGAILVGVEGWLTTRVRQLRTWRASRATA